MLKLVAAFVVGLGVGLAVSWGYILSLKAEIRVCMSYIHDRIGKDMAREHREQGRPEASPGKFV
jgi:hypothetical protein